jgi:hypothetical protein
MALHKPYEDDGAGGWVPQALTKDLKDVSGVVKLLDTAEARRDGVLAEIFHENGWFSVEAVAVDLRARGYEVVVYSDTPYDDKRIKLIAHPAAGAKRRKKDQMSLLGDVQPDSPLGPNG